MAVKFFVLIFFMTITSLLVAQENVRLELYDYSREENLPIAESKYVVDSTNAVADRPAFHPSQPVLYYIAHTQNNYGIVAFNFETGERKYIAQSVQKLLNPQVMADQKFVSCIQQAGDKYQLIKFSLAGGEAVVVSQDVNFKSHLWIDDNSLLVVADGDPNTLLLMTIRPKKAVPIANHVGETLQKGENIFAFVHKLSVDSWSVKKIMSNGSIDIMSETLPEADVFTLTADGKIIMVYENRFYISGKGDYKEIGFAPANDEIHSIGINSKGTKLYILTKKHRE